MPNAKSAVLQCLERYINIRERERIFFFFQTAYLLYLEGKTVYSNRIYVCFNLKRFSQTSPNQVKMVVTLTGICPYFYLALEKVEQA